MQYGALTVFIGVAHAMGLVPHWMIARSVAGSVVIICLGALIMATGFLLRMKRTE